MENMSGSLRGIGLVLATGVGTTPIDVIKGQRHPFGGAKRDDPTRDHWRNFLFLKFVKRHIPLRYTNTNAKFALGYAKPVTD